MIKKTERWQNMLKTSHIQKSVKNFIISQKFYQQSLQFQRFLNYISSENQ